MANRLEGSSLSSISSFSLRMPPWTKKITKKLPRDSQSLPKDPPEHPRRARERPGGVHGDPQTTLRALQERPWASKRPLGVIWKVSGPHFRASGSDFERLWDSFSTFGTQFCSLILTFFSVSREPRSSGLWGWWQRRSLQIRRPRLVRGA